MTQSAEFAVIIGACAVGAIFFAYLFAVIKNARHFFSYDRAPFVPVPRAVLSDIAAFADVRDSDIVYDLGCGDGRVLLALFKQCPHTRYVGIENAWSAYLLALARSLRAKGDRFCIRRADFFKEDLREATIVFVYLYPKVLDALLPKLESELKPGARVISCDFRFQGREPQKTANVGSRGEHHLFLYEF